MRQLRNAVLALLCLLGVSLAKPLLAQGFEPNAESSEVIFLMVSKSELKAELKTWPEDPSLAENLMSLRIAVGKAKGDKQVEGDNKTPEGIYFAQELIDGRTLPAKYGPFAIPINFPNAHDLSLGKTGYGIWLHGVEKDARFEEANVTEGCVAFYNADIETLSKWLLPRQTIVVIAEDSKDANDPLDLEAVTAATKNWVDAWRSRDIKSYGDAYSQTFKHRGRNLSQYVDYKKRVFASYKEMKVDISDIRVFSHNNYAISIMNQDFDGDGRYVSQGRKTIYWHRSQSGWKISHEVFETNRFLPQYYSKEFFAKVSENSPSKKQISKLSKGSAL